MPISDPSSIQNQLPHYYRSILAEFRSISRSFVYFNLLFLFLVTVEFSLLLISSLSLSSSFASIFLLGALLVTLFSYPILFFYYQAKKPEQFQGLLERFLHSCQTTINWNHDPKRRLSLAQTLVNLSEHLRFGEEIQSLSDSSWKFTAPLVSRLSARFLFKDTFHLKELLLREAIRHHLGQVRESPTDLESHVSLSSAYIALANLYREPSEGLAQAKLYRSRAPLFSAKFKACVELAIEELQILNQFAPNDPWVHQQLATGYQDLGLVAEEIKEREILLQLKPNDLSLLFRLGVLYFQKGANARGLQTYEQLKRAGSEEAEHLMAHYGLFKHPLFEEG